ncbi:MAG: cation diffusion facilitator family transporter, partial [Oscillospiraceae bacterium]|nr:cation diffusion facilitator family transporter [Oscillospiraceae bacterium]
LCATGVGIGYAGVRSALAGASSGGALAAPGLLALVAAAVSILVKEGLSRYTRAAAERTGSCALKADAWHHRSDALSSVGSFAGILGARLGLPILDPVAGAVLCVFIVKAAVMIFLDAVARMTDRACDDETTARILAAVARQPGVRGVDQLRTRLFGSRVYVDVEIRADGTVPLHEAHDIAQRVHDAIEAEFPPVKHCMVHVNPDGV